MVYSFRNSLFSRDHVETLANLVNVDLKDRKYVSDWPLFFVLIVFVRIDCRSYELRMQVCYKKLPYLHLWSLGYRVVYHRSPFPNLSCAAPLLLKAMKETAIPNVK